MTRNEKALIRMVDVQLLKEDMSIAEMSKELEVSVETIRRHINDWNNDRHLAKLAIRDSLLWVGIQVERHNIKMVEGLLKIEEILRLSHRLRNAKASQQSRKVRAGKKQKRQEELRDLIPQYSVSELAERFGVSEETIRRDMKEIAGGAPSR